MEDLEAIRQAAGYEKLVLYGTSYGTKVALDYAQRYPQNVASLVLDSTETPEGPEPFHISTFKAIRPALEELCARRGCNRVSATPLRDLAQLVSATNSRPLVGQAYDAHGRRVRRIVSTRTLFDLLLAGDLNAVRDDLKDPLRLRESLQVVLAEVAQLGSTEVGVVEGLAGRAGDEHLAPVARTADPGRAVHVDPVIGVVGEHRLSGVHPDPDANRGSLGPRRGAERALRGERGSERILGLGEGDEELVGPAVDLAPARLGDRVAHEPAVLREHLRVRLAEVLDEARRALDVREDQRDRAGGKPVHAASVRRCARLA